MYPIVAAGVLAAVAKKEGVGVKQSSSAVLGIDVNVLVDKVTAGEGEGCLLVGVVGGTDSRERDCAYRKFWWKTMKLKLRYFVKSEVETRLVREGKKLTC